MPTHDRLDEAELEVSSLGATPTPARRLSRRWHVALAVCALLLAVVAPLASGDSARALIGRLIATPTPTAETNAAVTIVNVATTRADLAPGDWDTLRARPLRLPTLPPGAACPAAAGRTVHEGYGPAIGDGPVYIVGMGVDGVLHAVGPTPGAKDVTAWGYQFAIFIISPSYAGPVLARGERLGGGRPLLFNGGLDQLTGFSPTTPILLRQLRMEGDPAFGSPWPSFPADLRMQAPGCYGIQLDGATFSEVIIFRVAFAG